MFTKITSYSVLFLYIVSLLGISLFALIALTTKVTIPGGYKVFTVASGSMAPQIPLGSLILTKAPSSEKNIQKGDIITFEEPGFKNKFVTHRVYEVKENRASRQFKTKGDSNQKSDEWIITYGRVQGIYIMYIPVVGFIPQYIHQPLGLIFLIIIPTMFLIILEIKNVIFLLIDMKMKKTP